MRKGSFEVFSQEKEVGVLPADIVFYGAIWGGSLHVVSHITRRKDTAFLYKAVINHNVNALKVQRRLI